MKTTRIFSISVCMVLILVVVFRFVFFISFIHSQKTEFRKEVLKGKFEQALTIKMKYADVFADKPGFEWKEKGRELVIHGVYHEVLSIHYAGGEALVTLIADKAENDLFITYFELHKKDDKGLHCFLSLILGLQFENAKTLSSYFIETTGIIRYFEPEKDPLYGHLNREIKPPLPLFS